MRVEESKDKSDILILLMIQERDKQIGLLEEENSSIKQLLIDATVENTNLRKRIKELSRRSK
ncbi:hypothetical protein [Faecalibacillus faecis]|uniref:hypothetical protein n=1 Tax=Faecalibacillus faecis TaxID=1982628 RepID=UPI00386707A1